MRDTLTLYAERECCEPRLIYGPAECSLHDLEELIVEMEDECTWPEGFDAVAVDQHGTRWLYDCEWSAL